MARITSLAAAVMALLSGSACEMLTGACTTELRMEKQPESAELNVGESFQASVELSSCGGKEELSDRITWSSSDPAIVAVNASSARVSAIRTGTAEVYGTGATYGLVATIPVTVR